MGPPQNLWDPQLSCIIQYNTKAKRNTNRGKMQVALAARQQRLVGASLTCCSKAPTTIARAPAGKPTYSTCLQIQIHRLKYRYTRKQTQSMLENIGTSTSLLHQHTNLPMPALLSFPLNFWKSIKIFDNLINTAISTQTSSFSPLLRDEYWRKKCCSTFRKKKRKRTGCEALILYRCYSFMGKARAAEL